MSSSPESLPPSWQHKYVHEMSSTERLQSLNSWAETKKFIQPGEAGTLPAGRLNALAFGGGLRKTSASGVGQGDSFAGQYEAPVGPPSYSSAMSSDGTTKERRKSGVGKWIERRKMKKAAEKNESGVPAYTP